MSKLLKAYDRSRVALYVQVASVMRRRIETGQWQPGQKISTLVELEREFQVARVTVRQAIEILQEEGLLDSQQGRGTFVSKKSPVRHWLKLATDWENLIAEIRDNVPKPIKVKNPPPLPRLEENEGTPAKKYVFLRSVQFKDGEPYGIVNLHLARSVYDRARRAFTERTALPVLASLPDLRIRDAHQTVMIGSADPETADFLKIALGAPTAECHCVVVDENGYAIYVADIVYRSDVIKLHIDLLGKATRKPRAGEPRTQAGKTIRALGGVSVRRKPRRNPTGTVTLMDGRR
jgi:GntR family transcriptional regulator